MKLFSKTLTKGAFASVAAGALAVAGATPAYADDHRDRDRGGIDGGDILAGALVLGGIAAVAAIASDKDDDRYDRYDRRYGDRYDRRDQRRHRNRGYNGRGNVELAVEQCVRAAERTARRYGGTRAEVYEIRDVDRERNGFEVKGRIAVAEGYGRRGRGYRNDRWDEGRFTCDWRRGRITDLDFSGIRGL